MRILILCTSNNCSLALLLYVFSSSVHKNRKHCYGTLKNWSKCKQMFNKWKQMMESDALLIKCYFMVRAGTWNIWVGLTKCCSKVDLSMLNGEQKVWRCLIWLRNEMMIKQITLMNICFVLVPITNLSSCQTLKNLMDYESWNQNTIIRTTF